MSTLGRERAALARRHRHRPDGLVEIASPVRVAEVLRGCGLADDPCRRQQWGRVYVGQTVMELTDARLKQAEAETALSAAVAGFGDLAVRAPIGGLVTEFMVKAATPTKPAVTNHPPSS